MPSIYILNYTHVSTHNVFFFYRQRIYINQRINENRRIPREDSEDKYDENRDS